MMIALHRSLVLTAAERYASLLLFLISTAALARLLSPQELGTYAVLGSLTALAGASFQEFGGANYLIQKKALLREDTRTAFTVTFCLSAAFAGLLFAARYGIEHFFAQSGLGTGLAVLDLTFLISPFSVTLSALLRRDMAFGVLARCNFAANAINAAVSVCLAEAGLSFMAPVWGTVAGSLALAVFLGIARPDLRIFAPRLRGVRDVLRFGVYSSAVVIVNTVYLASPQFILARVLDFSAVGLYGRAVSVTQVFDRLVVQVLNPVIMPAIFAATRAGGDLRGLYLSSMALISVVQWPFLIFLACLAEPLVSLWLGPTWLPIVPLMQILCVASLSLFAACLTFPVLVAAGRVRDTLVSSLISIPPSILLIAIGSRFGLMAVTASALLALPLQAAVSIALVGRRLGFGWTDVIRANAKSAAVTACACVGPMGAAVLQHVETGAHLSDLQLLVVAGLLAAAGWVGGLMMTGHPLHGQLNGAMLGAVGAWRRSREGAHRPA